MIGVGGSEHAYNRKNPLHYWQCHPKLHPSKLIDIHGIGKVKLCLALLEVTSRYGTLAFYSSGLVQQAAKKGKKVQQTQQQQLAVNWDHYSAQAKEKTLQWVTLPLYLL